MRTAVEKRGGRAMFIAKESYGGPGHSDLKWPVVPQILCIRDGSPDVGEILKHWAMLHRQHPIRPAPATP